METLVNDMVQADPAKRPKIDEIVSRFQIIRDSLRSWKLRSRIIDRGEWKIARTVRFLPHVLQTVGNIVTHKTAIPDP